MKHILQNIAPQHVTRNKELKSEILFCKCEKYRLRELQRGAQKRMLATLTSYERSCSYASASQHMGLQCGLGHTDKLHHHMPSEMLGNSGKLSVPPLSA